MLDLIVAQLVNGITLGGMYALIALGYTLVYGILLMINFAHSELFMCGAFVGLGVMTLLTSSAITQNVAWLGWLAPAQQFFTSGTVGMICMLAIVFLVSAIVVGIMGVIIERLAYRPLRHAPRLAPLISAVGVSIFLQNAVLLWVSSSQVPFPNPFGNSVAFTIGSTDVSVLKVVIVVTAIVLMVGLDQFISHSRMGKAMRATAQSHDLAGLMGVNVDRVIAFTFALGSGLGAIAGVMLILYYGIGHYFMGFMLGLKAFTAAVLGGIGNVQGAMLGGLLLGVIESLASGYIGDLTGGVFGSNYRDVFAFLVLIFVLVLRPSGLMGQKSGDRA